MTYYSKDAAEEITTDIEAHILASYRADEDPPVSHEFLLVNWSDRNPGLVTLTPMRWADGMIQQGDELVVGADGYSGTPITVNLEKLLSLLRAAKLLTPDEF